MSNYWFYIIIIIITFNIFFMNTIFFKTHYSTYILSHYYFFLKNVFNIWNTAFKQDYLPAKYNFLTMYINKTPATYIKSLI